MKANNYILNNLQLQLLPIIHLPDISLLSFHSINFSGKRRVYSMAQASSLWFVCSVGLSQSIFLSINYPYKRQKPIPANYHPDRTNHTI